MTDLESIMELVAERDTLRAEVEALLEILRYVRAVLPDERWADDTKLIIDATLGGTETEVRQRGGG